MDSITYMMLTWPIPGLHYSKRVNFEVFHPTHEFIREGSDFQIFAPSGPGDDVASMIEILAPTFD